MKFVNLHAHTTFSIGDGLNYPDDHFNFVLQNAESESMGMAITDHGNCNSFGYALQSLSGLKKKGINFHFIPGCEMYIHPDLDQWKILKEEEQEEDEEGTIEIESESKSKNKWYDPIKRRHHLVVLAQNKKGIENLNKLVSWSFEHGMYRYPRVDFKRLEKYNEGLIISTACLHPDSELITSKGFQSIKDVVNDIKNGEEVFVLSYDEENSSLEFCKVSWGDKTREKSKLYKIKLKSGKELKLTHDHKVFTERGYVEVQYLTKKDKILTI